MCACVEYSLCYFYFCCYMENMFCKVNYSHNMCFPMLNLIFKEVKYLRYVTKFKKFSVFQSSPCYSSLYPYHHIILQYEAQKINKMVNPALSRITVKHIFFKGSLASHRISHSYQTFSSYVVFLPPPMRYKQAVTPHPAWQNYDVPSYSVG